MIFGMTLLEVILTGALSAVVFVWILQSERKNQEVWHEWNRAEALQLHVAALTKQVLKLKGERKVNVNASGGREDPQGRSDG